MPATAVSARRAVLLLGGVLLLVSLNLRLSVASVPPVLEELRHGTGLPALGASLLTTAPVVCFGVGAPLAPLLARRIGGEATMLACLGAIAAGIALRLVAGTGALFAGTIVAGLAIAVANVVLPSVIKRDFARPGPMMGVYSMGINASGALAAGLTVPLEHATGSWRDAMAVWALPAVLALALWAPWAIAARRNTEAEPHPPAVSLWRNRLAWQVTALFACQSFLFYAMASWFPTLFRDHGMSDSSAGLLLSVALLLGIPAAFAMPVLAGRVRDQRILGTVTFALWAAGIAGLLVAPTTVPALWMVIAGLGQGAGIALVLMLFVVRAPDGATTAALSGMAQSVGYLIAGTGPFVVGAVHDATGGWTAPLSVMLAVTGAFLVSALAAGRPLLVRAGAR